MSQQAERPPFTSVEGQIAALNHSTDMMIHAADNRMRNFHYFLIASGFILVGLLNADGWAVVAIALVGVVLSAAFCALDVRTYRLIKDARYDLERKELLFDVTIVAVDQVPDPTLGNPGAGRKRLVSHTWVYRSVFVALGALFLAWGVAGLWA